MGCNLLDLLYKFTIWRTVNFYSMEKHACEQYSFFVFYLCWILSASRLMLRPGQKVYHWSRIYEDWGETEAPLTTEENQRNVFEACLKPNHLLRDYITAPPTRTLLLYPENHFIPRIPALPLSSTFLSLPNAQKQPYTVGSVVYLNSILPATFHSLCQWSRNDLQVTVHTTEGPI